MAWLEMVLDGLLMGFVGSNCEMDVNIVEGGLIRLLITFLMSFYAILLEWGSC